MIYCRLLVVQSFGELILCLARVRIDAGSRYDYENSSGVTQTNTATLSEADTLWVHTRHMHIKETIDKVISDLKAFQEQNGVFMKA